MKFLAAINSNIAAFATQSGSGSGTLTLWMPLQGSALKLVIIIWNNYQDASNRSFALPTAFVNNALIIIPNDIGITGNGGVQLLIGSTAQSLQVVSAIAAAGGSGTTQTTIFKNSIAGIDLNSAAIDHVQVLSSTAAHHGIAFIIGN